MRLLLTPVPAAVIAVALAGCGQGARNESTSGKFSGEQKRIATAVDDLQSATEDRDGAKICSNLLTAELQRTIAATAGAKGCGHAVKEAIKDTDQADLTVRTVTIDPEDPGKATAVVKEKTGDDKSRDETLRFEKQGGRWRISSLGS